MPAADQTDDNQADGDRWQSCYETLQKNVPDPAWMTCLRHLHLVEIDDGRVCLAVPTVTMRSRIHSRYQQTLLAALAEVGIENPALEIEVREDLPPPHDTNTADQTNMDESFAVAHEQNQRSQRATVHHNAAHDDARPDELGAAAAEMPGAARQAAGDNQPSGNNQTTGNGRVNSSVLATANPLGSGEQTFDNHVIGHHNRFASAAALAAAEMPGDTYNPLFIYAKVGLGKTHLLQAIQNYARTHHPKIKVCYVTAETFLNEFVDGMTNKNQNFKKYRSVDVLLLDDIQIIERKEAFQEEVFHTFNDLHTSKRQIVITSDRPPRNLATLSDRLRSRFEWGLVTDIGQPNLETRMAILRLKLRDTSYNVPNEVQELIAEKITNNIRELEGALTRVVAYSQLTQSPITLAMTQDLLGEMFEGKARAVTPKQIIETTVDRLGYSAQELSSPSRQQSLVKARHTCMYVMRELTDLSYPDIAGYFGNRDHTSVIHGVKKIGKTMHTDEDLFNQVHSLIDEIRAA